MNYSTPQMGALAASVLGLAADDALEWIKQKFDKNILLVQQMESYLQGVQENEAQ